MITSGLFSSLVSEYQAATWIIESLSGSDDCRILSLKYPDIPDSSEFTLIICPSLEQNNLPLHAL